jgi:hypothetical protein
MMKDEMKKVDVLKNYVDADGMRRLRLLGAEQDVRLQDYVSHQVLRRFPQVVEVAEVEPNVWDVSVPVFGVTWVRLYRVWREVFMVHQVYGTGMRDCVRLGVEAWLQAQRQPRYAVVNRLPRGVEAGTEVQGVLVFEAEWMTARAVAVVG